MKWAIYFLPLQYLHRKIVQVIRIHICIFFYPPDACHSLILLCGSEFLTKTPLRPISMSESRPNANRQTSFSGRGYACIKLPFSGHTAIKFRRPTILQLNIEGLTAGKMNVLHHLALQSEALVILLQETAMMQKNWYFQTTN